MKTNNRLNCYFVVIDEQSYWVQWEEAQGILHDDPIDCLLIDPLKCDSYEVAQNLYIATTTISILHANNFILEWATKYSILETVEDKENLNFDQKLEAIQLINLHSILQDKFRSALNFDLLNHTLGTLETVWVDHRYRYLIYKQEIYKGGAL
tara:strand:+ start:52 stop:507 length:456 start_codon:yes stop_codon:yes gene_type:complete